jgi:hypothetical protein
MSDGTMTPEEYAKFMGQGADEEPEQTKDDKEIDADTLDKIRIQLKQAGVTTDNIDKVLGGIKDIIKGEIRTFNFVRGHVRRATVRRELNGKLTVITF